MNPSTFLLDLFIVALFAIGVYAFLIAPRQREFKKRRQLIETLQPGAEVVTFGGLIGRVRRFDRSTGIVTVEVADGVELRMVAAAITREFNAEEYAESARKALGKKDNQP